MNKVDLIQRSCILDQPLAKLIPPACTKTFLKVILKTRRPSKSDESHFGVSMPLKRASPLTEIQCHIEKEKRKKKNRLSVVSGGFAFTSDDQAHYLSKVSPLNIQKIPLFDSWLNSARLSLVHAMRFTVNATSHCCTCGKWPGQLHMTSVATRYKCSRN